MEVIYLGMRLGIDQLADAVVDEDADIVALNFAGADHLNLAPRVMAALRERGREDDLLVVAGGIIPDEDIPGLEALGIARVFLPGTPLEEIVAYLQRNVPERAV
jgi:methylmalonyl-CoA mutase C-terminal domain/subunit